MCKVCNNKGYVRVFEHNDTNPKFFVAGCGVGIDSEKMLKREGASAIKGVNRQREIIVEYDDGTVATTG